MLVQRGLNLMMKSIKRRSASGQEPTDQKGLWEILLGMMRACTLPQTRGDICALATLPSGEMAAFPTPNCAWI